MIFYPNKRWSYQSNRNALSIALIFIAMFLPQFLSGQVSNTSLENTLIEIEQAYEVSISYNSNLLKKVEVLDSNTKGLSLEYALVKLLRGTNWQFEIMSDNYVIIREADPDFLTQYHQLICGKILDKQSKEVLISANIQIKNMDTGCSTNDTGQFNLKAPYVTNDSLVISYLGYQGRIIPVSFFKNKACPTIYLAISSSELSPIVVNNQRKAFLFSEPVPISADQFDIQKIDWIGGQVEKDVFQLLQLLPGIISQEESASDIHIRGGGSDQNLVLYDDIPMYHFGHFFGKVAAVNPYFSEKISLFKEGVSSIYGGRASGVIDIKSKSNIPSKWKTTIDVNTLSANIGLHLPLFKKKGHFLLTYRRSLTDIFESNYFQNTFDQIFQNSRIVQDQKYVKIDSIEDISSLIPITKFKDLSLKWSHKVSDKDEWSISYTNMTNALFYNYIAGDWYQSVDTLKINNQGLSIQTKHHWNKEQYFQGLFSYSGIQSSYKYLSNLLDTMPLYNTGNQNQIEDYSIKLSNHWKYGMQTIQAGYQFNLIKEGHNVYYIDPSPTQNYHWADSIQGQTHTFFVDYHFDVPKLVHFNLGLRGSHYNLTDKVYLEPRFFAKIHPKENWTLKVASGIYFQTINQVVDYNELNSDSKLWVLSRDSDEEGQVFFSVVKNAQFSTTLNYKYFNWAFNLSLYKKALTGITSKSNNFNDDFPWVTGDMSAQGLELGIQKMTDNFSSILSYTLSSSIYDFEYFDYLVPANYDQRHTINWAQTFKYKKLSLSSTLKWHTGTPFSEGVKRLEDRSDPDNIGYWLEFDKYNGNRLSNYFRLDLSLTWKFNIKKTNGRVTFAVLNIFNRRNILQRNYYLNYQDYPSPPKIIEANKFGIPLLPNIGFSIDF